MFTGDKERYERYLKGTLRQTGWITEMQLGDGGVCKEDIVVLTKPSLIAWLRAHFDDKAPMQEEFIAMLLGHVPTELTVDDFTVENALYVMDAPMCVEGRCTPERPFGQCTVWLPNKTPVHRMTFPKATLEFLAGKNDGVTYLDEWMSNVHSAMRRERASEERAEKRERERAGEEHRPRGRELTELLEFRGERTYPENDESPLGLGDLIELHAKLQRLQSERDTPRGAIMDWWAVTVNKEVNPGVMEKMFVFEAADEQDVESLASNFVGNGWLITRIVSFKEWLRHECR